MEAQFAFIDVNVRVCGDEVLSVKSPTSDLFAVYPLATGDMSLITDPSQRWSYIHVTDFQNDYVVTPTGDACELKGFNIWKSEPDVVLTTT